MAHDGTTKFNDDPLALAVGALMELELDLFEALRSVSVRAGVPYGSDRFDEAAALAGIPYSRALDLYVDEEDYEEAEQYPLAHMRWAEMTGARERCPEAR